MKKKTEEELPKMQNREREREREIRNGGSRAMVVQSLLQLSFHSMRERF